MKPRLIKRLPMKRRALLAAALAAPTILAMRNAWAGQPINLIVAAPAGSGADLLARAFAPFLERHLAHGRVNILNRPGDGGMIAYRTVADAFEAGGTLGWVATPPLVARSIDHPDAAGLVSRLHLIGAVQNEPICLLRDSDDRFDTVNELVYRAAVNTEAQPLATPPSGSPGHLAALQLQADYNTPLNIIAFPSAAAARQATIDGNAAGAVLGLSDAADALRTNQLVKLDTSSLLIWRGLAAPIGLPEPAADRLATALQTIATDPEFAAQGNDLGFTAVWQSGAAWTAQAEADRTALTKLWQAGPWLPPIAG